jgi:hypothetical protein
MRLLRLRDNGDISLTEHVGDPSALCYPVTHVGRR